jgi:RNA polymerase sigma-32 factor
MAITSSMSEGSSISSLARYLQEIRKYPTLEPEQELRLARRWTEHQDPRAAEALVTSHLGLIVKIAHGFRGYGLPLAELVAEGNVGMMQAIVRFDPGRGFRLSTYAMWWIRASILEYILRSWSMVRLCTTPRHKRLFFKLRKIKGQLRAIEEGDLAPETVAVIARQLDVSETDVVIMNRRMAGPDRSLNAPVTEDGDDQWQDWLVDPSESVETTLANRQELDVRRVQLAQAMVHLSERERHILTERRLMERPKKLDELAAHYGVSRERIRQIEERAFRKLQQAMGITPVRAKAKPAPVQPIAAAPVHARPMLAPAALLPVEPEDEWDRLPDAYPGSFVPRLPADWMHQPEIAG